MYEKLYISNENYKANNPGVFIGRLFIATLINLIIQNNYRVFTLDQRKLDMFLNEKITYWFRGQNNFNWGLTPSYFRGMVTDKIVNYSELEKDYSRFGLLPKFEKIFHKTIIGYNV